MTIDSIKFRIWRSTSLQSTYLGLH